MTIEVVHRRRRRRRVAFVPVLPSGPIAAAFHKLVPAERRALETIVATGDAFLAGGRRWLLCPLPDELADTLACVGCAVEDLEQEPDDMVEEDDERLQLRSSTPFRPELFGSAAGRPIEGGAR